MIWINLPIGMQSIPIGCCASLFTFGDAIMSSTQLHEKVKAFNRLPAGNPEKAKLADEIETAIKKNLGQIALKLV